MKTLTIKTSSKKEIVDLSDKVNQILAESNFQEGVCNLFLTHTTAALTTGEFGEGTAEDLLEVAEKIIPKINFRHAHDPSHAWSHMASSLIGDSLTIPVHDGKLVLGTWQSVLLVELDGPKERQIVVSLQNSTKSHSL